MLEEVRKHIEELIARYEAEKVENERLRAELQACKETGDALRRQVLDLESAIETLNGLKPLPQAATTAPPKRSWIN